ncbi:acetyl-CoA carboxylase biotin carboxyl carrier protein [Micromonospora sp. NPDC000316]|uniref:acetyl-CoA carboxylase biotin carboxyl carrier protein n=1 Tax=Micromonospora sp. NPDC000316 TaxID=3364216 RepID=UPI0036B23C06
MAATDSLAALDDRLGGPRRDTHPSRDPSPVATTSNGRPDGHRSTDVAGSADDVVGGEEVLAGLRRQARHLIAELAGPVRRIQLRSGPTVLEVEWHPAEAPARPDVPADSPPAAATPTTAVVPGPPTSPIRPPVPGRTAVRAPIVGTFYRAPEPGVGPFVAVGDLVRPGQPVAIVEAMKLMNEVTADRAGRVVAVLVEDGQPVEYDQPLVELDPA